MKILIYILTAEKIIQHLLLAVFFIVYIPEVGTPDIGDKFVINDGIMAFLNLLYVAFFAIGLWAIIKQKRWGSRLVMALALLDIILEFTFHGFGFITVSVIVSIFLSTFLALHLKNKNRTIN